MTTVTLAGGPGSDSVRVGVRGRVSVRIRVRVRPRTLEIPFFPVFLSFVFFVIVLIFRANTTVQSPSPERVSGPITLFGGGFGFTIIICPVCVVKDWAPPWA